ncbi:methyltransferase domain-containing protein [Flavivirga aquimarina]|uniref:Methyltransferase domain-containing protein n=1 Tax=Flavivirga aquimarina TaxID=2027862 RepID=A0ABT8WBR1_9FLAO|nr:class I SAM-dependent methyltransferase [Flavivirga aquimarina]MDO5970560.1 methyltransferase domain-containing protein [Flavivirga aquimarina]
MSTEPKIYSNRGAFAKEMLQKYKPKESKIVVSDIGAGFGHMEETVLELGAQWQPFDIIKKIDKSIIWDLNDRVPEGTEKANLVIFLEVLEHLDNPLLGLQNIANHMEKDGVLVLTTPNPQSSKNTLSLFLRGALFAFQEKHIEENHVFTPWKHIVIAFLKRCGLEVLEYAIVDIEYKKRKISSFKDWIKYRVEAFIESRNPMTQGMSYGIVAKKIKE